MNTPHLHLLINHVPTVGTVIAVAILILSFLRKNEGMRRVSFELFCVIALITLPAYLSGVGTQLVLEQQPDVSPVLIATHHDAALIASLFMVLTGGAAWLALWQTRRTKAELDAAFRSLAIGEFTDMRVIQRGESERLISTEIVGTTGRSVVPA